MFTRDDWLYMAKQLYGVAQFYTDPHLKRYYRSQARECLAEAGWHVV